MGLLDRLGLSRRKFDALSTPIMSPWSPPGDFGALVVSEALGTALSNLPMGRAEALTVPAVARAQALLTTSVAKLPLRALNSDGTPVADQPSWLYRTNGAISPFDRTQKTVDDLIFFGNSVWLTTRGADGFILEAEHCSRELWTVRDGDIYLAGRDTPLDATECVVFDPIFPGLLALGARNLRGAMDVERAWHRQARNPIPLMVLQASDDSVEQDEADAYVAAFSKARNSENGAVGFLPSNITMQVFGQSDPGLMTSGRNATRADVGAYLNIPSSMLDGTQQESSLTYSTQEGNRNSFFEFSVPTWTGPIEARLSQDDVVPRGQRVRFDTGEEYAATPTPTGAPEQD